MTDTIYIDIVEKNGNNWRIIGVCPASVTDSRGLHITRGEATIIRDCASDAIILCGMTLRHALSKLATKTGMTVLLTDETTWQTVEFTPKPGEDL